MKVELEIKSFGQYFRYKMQERKTSTRGVAEELCMNPSTIWRIASDYNFALKWIIPVAKWCGLSPKQLWDLLESFTLPAKEK